MFIEIKLWFVSVSAPSGGTSGKRPIDEAPAAPEKQKFESTGESFCGVWIQVPIVSNDNVLSRPLQ